ncbi:Molybdopterin synthase catalytic subunit [Phytophthora cinnamomi]|uniref:Molybdopterin synthase catalytic subunit n=1 Tax=Phytophthora cinnamomi TaxID=4785 RepID=UPI00355A2E13|nr:Molybdopterin synthase catalytic subunit [Phytophthora cinnamomi]
MAIAKSLFRKPVVDAEVPKHKGLALLGFGRHHKALDVTVENPPSSRRVTRKHKRSYAGHQPQQQQQLECSCSCGAVYDQCLNDAMTLKERLHRDNSKPATRFRLAVMKRVVVPPVSIPKSIAEHRGSKDFVGGHRVPFTRCMWETEKMRQQLVLRRLYMLPMLREDACIEA